MVSEVCPLHACRFALLLALLTEPRCAEDELSLFSNVTASVLFTPCHTTGHVSFLLHASEEGEPDALFCGDTLFVGGCGRFFEGSAAQMYGNVSGL
jgi:glyoxylase-like metal-dependent hydrolase (beta-lactamase superfamily II)